MVRPGKTFCPDPEATRRYAALAQIYDRITDFTDPLFDALAPAQCTAEPPDLADLPAGGRSLVVA